MASDDNSHFGSSEVERPKRGRSMRDLNPIPIALAIGIVACAVPMGYRISKCSSFTGGLSLTKLFSISCEKSTDAAATPSSTPHSPPVSIMQYQATPLAFPQGFVAYRVNDGAARESGSLVPFDGNPAPAFKNVAAGTILRATATKRLRQRPYAQSENVEEQEGTCFKVIEGFRYEDEPPTDHTSGGWLPVELASCNQAGPTPQMQRALRPLVQAPKTPDSNPKALPRRAGVPSDLPREHRPSSGNGPDPQAPRRLSSGNGPDPQAASDTDPSQGDAGSNSVVVDLRSTELAAAISMSKSVVFQTDADGDGLRHAQMWLSLSREKMRQIRTVKYYFSNPAFFSPKLSAVGSRDFRTKWTGYACSQTITAVATLINETELRAVVDMCPLWEEAGN